MVMRRSVQWHCCTFSVDGCHWRASRRPICLRNHGSTSISIYGPMTAPCPRIHRTPLYEQWPREPKPEVQSTRPVAIIDSQASKSGQKWGVCRPTAIIAGAQDIQRQEAGHTSGYRYKACCASGGRVVPPTLWQLVLGELGGICWCPAKRGGSQVSISLKSLLRSETARY